MNFRLIAFLVSFLFFSSLYSQSKIASLLNQNRKSLEIVRTENPPKIDGVLDDEAWVNALEAKDFTEFRPTMGLTEKPGQETVVKMTYDDEAIYIAAYLYDSPELIMKQITSRDNFGQNDFFLVVFNPNNDAQNDTQLLVFPSGTQADAIASPGNGEDFGWNAVWESAVKIVDDGWIVEMKVPYSVLRFSNQEEPTWGIQFHRQFRKTREQYSWSPIDVTKGNIGLYHGELNGLKNIKPPTRLSLYPFASTLINSFDGKTTDDFTLGLDVKYGISENFTLDMTLIPDFSQAGFDNRVLNLGPFEQTFSEQRQFFTEGVDLFNKGNLFFSRRIGNGPSGTASLDENEKVINSPSNVKVLNAVKVSGRTKSGLGVGVFNAITETTNAVIRDTITGQTRDEVVEPLTNYNILVLDQQYNGNSSISLINTNVTRSGSFRDANVTGLLADITNKRNTYNINGELKMSNLNDFGVKSTGFSTFLKAGKVHGNFRYSVDHSYADTKYNINDLGLQFRNNFNNLGIDASFRIFEPTKKLNNYNISTYINYTRLADPNVYTGNGFGFRYSAQTKTLHNFGGNLDFEAGKQFDYFEPRVQGRYFIYENRFNSNLWVSTNYNNTFAFDANFGGTKFFEDQRNTHEFWIGFNPRVRVNEKFLLKYSIDYSKVTDDRGYTTMVDDDIIFGERDQKTVVNRISGNYNFNSYHALSLTFRNYWSTVTYDNDLFTLAANGRLTKEQGYTIDDIKDPNVNFNTWNLDLSYSWQFAPGSLISALYRNQLFNLSSASSENYTDSLNSLFEQPIQHTFSLRLVYFIDYNNVKNIFSNKTS